MSAWIVYSKDGRAERCALRSLEYGGTHMGERAVTATFDSASEVAFEVFDYIEYRGEKFELEAVPTVKKTSDFNYEYELRFVSLKYELERCEMRDLVPNDNGVVYPTPLTFTFTGDVRYLVERIQACLDDLYGKGVWSIIVADDVKSEEKNISIAQQNCWNALALVSTTYGLNFYVKGRTITIGGEQSLVGHTFEYGKANGLYEIERAADTGTGIVTKLRAYGASRNLDYSYPKKPEWSDSVLPVSFALSPLRLMLPSFKTDGKTDYVLADEATIAKYGIREASMVYDDIYPTITGATYNGQAIDEIKSVGEVDEIKNTFSIELYDLGFDLEEHLTTSDAQISMKTGTLQGYTFNISTIEKLEGGYKLTLGRNSLENSEESGAYVPSKDWNMAKGDKFVLLNILMPQAYIREAENRLLVRAKEYLAQYGKTNFSYNIGLHDKFLVEHPSVYDALVEGARLSVYDAELGISENVTIQSITITENMEENILPQVKVTLNNEPSASTLDRIQGKLNEVAAETAANSFSSQSELMAQYRKKLDKPFFEKLFVAIDKDGNEIAANDMKPDIAYLKSKFGLVVSGGITMYAEDEHYNVPSIYDGLPIDWQTIYWENVTDEEGNIIGKVLKAAGGGGSGEGGGGGLTIEQVAAYLDANKYATQSWVEKKGYATQSWVEGKGYLTSISKTMVTNALGYTPLDSTKFTKDSIKSTLGISDWALESVKPSYKFSELLETPTTLSGYGVVDLVSSGNIQLGGKPKYAFPNYLNTTSELLSGFWHTLIGYNGCGLIIGEASNDRVILQAFSNDDIDKPFNLLEIQDNLAVTGDLTTNGLLSVNGVSLRKLQNETLYIDGNLVVKGGISMYSDASGYNTNSVMDALVVDGVNLKVINRVLTFVGSSGGGGMSSVGKITFTMPDGSIVVYDGTSDKNIAMTRLYKASEVTTATSDDGAITPYAMNQWATKKFALKDGTDASGVWGISITGSASRLNTTSKTAWGQTYWNSGGVPDSISGDLSNVGNITFENKFKSIGVFGTYLQKIYVNAISGGSADNNLWLISGNGVSGSTGIVFARNSTGELSNEIARLTNSSFYPYSSSSMSLGKADSLWSALYSNTGNFSGHVTMGSTTINGTATLYASSGDSPSLVFLRGSTGDSNNDTRLQNRGGYFYMDFNTTGTGWVPAFTFDRFGNFLATGGITMYSDIRKKTKLKEVELSLKQIADAPLIEHYYNSDINKTTHVGSIAQYWAGMNDWFCKLDNDGYYTMEIQNAALASAISIARELVKYESKTDRRIRLLKQRVKELEDKIEKLKNN